MSSRFHLVLTEARQYLADGTNITSTGARLDMWKHALLMFADSPLWGHGTSGYRVLAEKIFLGEIECATNCIHPHNQFLFFGALTTIGLTVASIVRARRLGAILALMRMSPLRMVSWLAQGYIWLFPGTPLLVQLLISYTGLPLAVGVRFSVLEAALPAAGPAGATPASPPAAVAADGLYRVLVVEYQGDTAGNDWYADLTCLAADGSAPAGRSWSR